MDPALKFALASSLKSRFELGGDAWPVLGENMIEQHVVSPFGQKALVAEDLIVAKGTVRPARCQIQIPPAHACRFERESHPVFALAECGFGSAVPVNFGLQLLHRPDQFPGSALNPQVQVIVGCSQYLLRLSLDLRDPADQERNADEQRKPADIDMQRAVTPEKRKYHHDEQAGQGSRQVAAIPGRRESGDQVEERVREIDSRGYELLESPLGEQSRHDGAQGETELYCQPDGAGMFPDVIRGGHCRVPA
jgi:hypothetical protein